MINSAYNIILAALFIFFSVTSEGFLSLSNITNLLRSDRRGVYFVRMRYDICDDQRKD